MAVAWGSGEVEVANQVQLAALLNGGLFAREDIGDGGIAESEDGTLPAGGEKAAAEIIEPTGGDESAVENDEVWEVLAFGAEAITEPGAHGWPPLQAGTCVQEVVGVGVFGKVGRHGPDHGEVVDVFGDFREEVADGDA